MKRLYLFLLVMVLGTSLPLLAQGQAGMPPEMKEYLDTLTESQCSPSAELGHSGVLS